MESMPRVPMIAPDMKYPEQALPPALIPKLRQYILDHYNDNLSGFTDAFLEFKELRYHVAQHLTDVESICIMKRYYSQLCMMKSRFPMEAGESCAVPYSWLDRSLDMTNGTVFEDVNFELANVMYNIGAAHATVAVNETRLDMDSIKNAFSHFQCAAGAFQDLMNNNSIASFGLVSFDKGFLEFFLKLLLAQAQECLIEKAIIDKRMNTAIAKLACFASETYYELYVKLENPVVADYLPSNQYKAWRTLCGSKGHLYAAISRMHLGEHAGETKKYGEKLAHYAAALSHINDATKAVQKDKRESLKEAVSYLRDIIVKREQSIRKDNEFIYHERIPLAEELTQVEARPMVNAISFDPCDRSISGDDLFAALLPANVLKGVSEYSEEKARLKRQLVEKIENRDDELNQYLWSMNFSELNLDQPESEVQLPQELLNASAAFTTAPHAFSDLVSKLNDIADKSRKTDIELTELSRRLEAVKCPKLETDEGYQAISTRVAELKEHHAKARANNIELHKILADQSEQLKILALPFHELAKYICNKVINAADTPEGMVLRKVIDKVDEMRRQRAALFMTFETEIENDDVTSKVLADKNLDLKKLFASELKKHDKSIKLIEMNMTAQDNILNKLTEANANFAEMRHCIVENNELRKKQCGKLIAAHEVFTGVKERTEAAEIFFNQLFTLIRDLGKAVSIMEETFAGERERHEEQQKLVAERALAYRERIAIENANLEVSSSLPNERRRPKLIDYMAYYRNKLAPGAQSQLPRLSSNEFLGYENANTTKPSLASGASSLNSLDSLSGPKPTLMENELKEQIPSSQQGPRFGQASPSASMPQQYSGSVLGSVPQQFSPYGIPQHWEQQSASNMYAPLPVSLQQPIPPVSLQSQASFSDYSSSTVTGPSLNVPQQVAPRQYGSSSAQPPIALTPASKASEPNDGLHTPAVKSSTKTTILTPLQVRPGNAFFPSQQFEQQSSRPGFAPGAPQFQQVMPLSQLGSSNLPRLNSVPLNQFPSTIQVPHQQPNVVQSQQLSQMPGLHQSLNSNSLPQPQVQILQPFTNLSPLNSSLLPQQLNQPQNVTLKSQQLTQPFNAPTSEIPVLNDQLSQARDLTSLPSQRHLPMQILQPSVPQIPSQQQPLLMPQQIRSSIVVPSPKTGPQSVKPMQLPQALPFTSNAQQNGYQVSQQQRSVLQQIKPTSTNHPKSTPQQPQSTPQSFRQTNQTPQILPQQQLVSVPQQSGTQVPSTVQTQQQSTLVSHQQFHTVASSTVVPQPQQIPTSILAPTLSPQQQEQDLMFTLADDNSQNLRGRPLASVNPKNLSAPRGIQTNPTFNEVLPIQSTVNRQSTQLLQNWMPQQSQAPAPQVRSQQNPNTFQQQWEPQTVVSTPQQQVQPSPKPDNVPQGQQNSVPVPPFTITSGIAPSPYANMYKKPTASTANAVSSPWHRSLPTSNTSTMTTAPVNNAYVSPFSGSNRYQNGIQQQATPSPFQSINSGRSISQNDNYQQRDITADLLDNLFAPTQTVLDFSRQHENHVGTSGPSSQAMLCRPAATVLPMRRPDGTWSTGANDSNAILSFTNVQSVSVSEDGTERPINGVGPL